MRIESYQNKLIGSPGTCQLTEQLEGNNVLEIPQDHYGTVGIKVANAFVKLCSSNKLRYDQEERHIVVLDSKNLSQSELTINSFTQSPGWRLYVDGSRNKDENLLIKFKAVCASDGIIEKPNLISNNFQLRAL